MSFRKESSQFGGQGEEQGQKPTAHVRGWDWWGHGHGAPASLAPRSEVGKGDNPPSSWARMNWLWVLNMQKASWPVSQRSDFFFFFCLAEWFSFFFDSAHPCVNAGHLSLGKDAGGDLGQETAKQRLRQEAWCKRLSL